MKVWRYENTRRVGPYRGSELFEYHNGDPKRPGPAKDGARVPDGANARLFKYGFESVASVKRWFTPSERKLMEDKGYKLKCYEVPAWDVIRGFKQVAFRYKSAKQISRKA